MNNAQDGILPNVEAAIPSWPIYTAIRNIDFDIGANEDLRLTYRLNRRMLLAQMHLMGDTRCQACGGRAHVAADCPTQLRLDVLGASRVEWSALIANSAQLVALDA